MKTIAAIVLVLVVSVSVQVVADGAGLALLKHEFAAGPAGMGGAVVSLEQSPSLVGYSPATVSAIDKFAATLGHTMYWERIRFESAAFAMPMFDKVNFLGSIRLASIDELELRDEVPTAEPIGYFDSRDITGKFGFSYQYSPRVSFGAAVGWIYEKIEGWRGSKMSFDIGARANVYPNLDVGLAAVGIGGDLALSKDGSVGSRDIPLPTTWRLGASYTYRDYLGAADLVIVDDETHLHFGAVGRLHQSFALRAGYMAGYDSKNITAGASFILRDVTVDYAFLPFSDGLGTSHLFNLTFTL